MKRLMVIMAVVFPLAAQPPVRMAWQEFARDPARVASFRKAVAVMKSRDTASPTSADYRGSWEYWGAMHGYFGTTSPWGTKEAYMQKYGFAASSPYWVGVRDLTPPDAIATTVWNQCQHGTQYFMPWHRLFLYYFERALQKAAGDPNLRLPYWDYTDTNNLEMPQEFTQPTYVDGTGAAVPNPLYDARREPGWSSGSKLDGTVTNIDRTLELPDFLGDGQFQSAIEKEPHGNVHCAVAECWNTVMGSIGYSANDPIFWVHHCNIDRMWDCWHSISGHKNPTDSYLTQKFSYLDENGNVVTKSVDDIINGGMVDYVYDHPSNCARQATTAKVPETEPMTAAQLDQAQLSLAQPVVLGVTKGISINSLTTRKSVALPNTTENGSQKRLALTAPRAVPLETDLVLKDIKLNLPPGTSFNIYVESKADPKKRVLVGSLNFFRRSGDTVPDQVFNVTDILPTLGTSGKLDQVNVVFEASTGRTGAKEAAPTLNANAHLVIGEIDFVVRLREQK